MKSTSKLIIFIFTLLALAAGTYAADDSPLFESVKRGDKAAVEALLAKGADVNAKDKDGGTPLHWAAHEGKRDIAELLENHIIQRSRNPRELLVQLTTQLKDNPDDGGIRHFVINLAGRMKPPRRSPKRRADTSSKARPS
ncbi:MAG: ankyrin repeat domain-containing protein [Sulfuricaulis sp.]|nr:ankyrin repeat domain-containing protein [Sulfuricaulis sp.]